MGDRDLEQLGKILDSCTRAERRRAARGCCLRCGHPPERHSEQVVGHSEGRDIVVITCGPNVESDYEEHVDG